MLLLDWVGSSFQPSVNMPLKETSISLWVQVSCSHLPSSSVHLHGISSPVLYVVSCSAPPCEGIIDDDGQVSKDFLYCRTSLDAGAVMQGTCSGLCGAQQLLKQ